MLSNLSVQFASLLCSVVFLNDNVIVVLVVVMDTVVVIDAVVIDVFEILL